MDFSNLRLVVAAIDSGMLQIPRRPSHDRCPVHLRWPGRFPARESPAAAVTCAQHDMRNSLGSELRTAIALANSTLPRAARRFLNLGLWGWVPGPPKRWNSRCACARFRRQIGSVFSRCLIRFPVRADLQDGGLALQKSTTKHVSMKCFRHFRKISAFRAENYTPRSSRIDRQGAGDTPAPPVLVPRQGIASVMPVGANAGLELAGYDKNQKEDLPDRLRTARLASRTATARFARAVLCSGVMFAAAVFPPFDPPSDPPFAPCFLNHSRTSDGSFLGIARFYIRYIDYLSRGTR